MAQMNAGTGFRYPFDVETAMRPWQEKLTAVEYADVVKILSDRDRALEDYFASAVPVFDQIDVEESTTSTTDTDLATVGPIVTVKLPRGRAIVTGGAYMTSTVTNQTVGTVLYIDGNFQQDMALLGNNTGGSLSASTAHTVLVTEASLSPGSHTFQLKYFQSLPGANVARFAGRYLMVVPIP